MNLLTYSQFINEKDSLSDLDIDLDTIDTGIKKTTSIETAKDATKDVTDKSKEKEKKEIDPIKKLQDEEKEKKEDEQDEHKKFLQSKIKELQEVIDKYPELSDLGNKLIDVVKTEDRTKIHAEYNELIYLQVKYQENNDQKAIDKISKFKDILDELDRSFSNDKNL